MFLLHPHLRCLERKLKPEVVDQRQKPAFEENNNHAISRVHFIN